MKKIKNAFGRFYLNHPKIALGFTVIALILALFFGGCFGGILGTGSFSEILSGGFFFFLVLFFFLFSSSDWAKKLPEYTIQEAEKILESEIISPKLESLMERVKTNREENGLNELKNWLELFEDYKSLKENLPQLQEQQDEITTKISESISKKNQLRMDLVIA